MEESEKEEKMKIVLIIVSFFLIFTFAIILFHLNDEYKEKKQLESSEKYCISWGDGGYLKRDNMINNCRDWKDNRWGCLWLIDKENILHLYESDGSWKSEQRILNDAWKKNEGLREIGNWTCHSYVLLHREE